MINAGSLELNAPAQMNGGMERAQRLTQVRGAAATGLYLFYLLSFICQRGRRVAGGELRHLAGSPGGGGVIRSCHTLVRVNTV